MTSATPHPEEETLLHRLLRTDDALSVVIGARQAGVLRADQAVRLWQTAQGQSEARRQTGAYYTSTSTARDVARRAMADMAAPPPRILEPSCGGGALLEAAIHEGMKRWKWPSHAIAAHIEAWDLDPVGIALAQWRIAEAFDEATVRAITWHQGDTLAHLPDAPYDWIFGNPPFGNAIERATRRTDPERARFARAFPLAARGAFDKCSLFVEWAAQHISTQGLITYILPRSWLAQPAATRLRKHLAANFHLRSIAHLNEDTFFEASVSTIAISLEHLSDAPAQNTRRTDLFYADGREHTLAADVLLRSGNWGAAVHPFAPVLAHAAPALSSIAESTLFSAGAATEEAYAWAPHVIDEPSHDLHHPQTSRRALLIAGRIDPFENDWGTKPTRYLGKDYLHPTLCLNALRPKRQQLHAQPRALLPTLSVALEATVDLDAAFIGAVSTICAWPASLPNASSHEQKARTLLLAAMLNSAWLRLQYHCYFGMLALQGGNTQVSKNKLRTLQIPKAWTRLLQETPRAFYLESGAMRGTENPSMRDLPSSLTLTKKLPSFDLFYTLCDHARSLHASTSFDMVCTALAHRLWHHPKEALYRGEIDVLLLALAPDLLQRVETLRTVR